MGRALLFYKGGMTMANVQECIDTIRRRIGDTDDPFTFTDEIIIGYLSDAVAEVELDYPRNMSINITLGLFDHDISISTPDVVVFSIKAHYLIKLRTKDKADRDNFVMRKGRLTLDNTNQAKDHKDTLDVITKEYNRKLFQLKNNGNQKGVRVE
jgi:hypothetical protein